MQYKNAISLCLACSIFVISTPADANSRKAQEKETQEIATSVTPAQQKGTYNVGAFFGHTERDGDGKELNSNDYTLRITEKLAPGRSQFFMASGTYSGYKERAVNVESANLSLSYGQIWQSSNPDLTYNLSGFIGRNQSERNGGSNESGYAAGVIGGFNQLFAVDNNNLFMGGASLSLSYLNNNNGTDGNDGFTTTIFPYVQYTNFITPQLSGYARVTGTLSNHEAAISGEHALITPAIGFDYALDDYNFGIKYSREFMAEHSGDRIGFSITRAF